MNYNKDVLADILNDPQTKSQPESAELIRLVYRSGPKKSGIERTHSPDPVQKNEDMEPVYIRKKKATYYLSKKVLVELCDAKAKIKVLVPSELKTKVSMSRIVDYAIGSILEEFNLLGHESDLMQQFLTDKMKRDAT